MTFYGFDLTYTRSAWWWCNDSSNYNNQFTLLLPLTEWSGNSKRSFSLLYHDRWTYTSALPCPAAHTRTYLFPTNKPVLLAPNPAPKVVVNGIFFRACEEDAFWITKMILSWFTPFKIHMQLILGWIVLSYGRLEWENEIRKQISFNNTPFVSQKPKF